MLPSVNWAYHPLSELAAHSKYSCVGGPFGSNLGTADYVYDGVPVIRGQNLGRDRWVGEEFVYVTEEKADSLTSNLAYPGDLIFTQRGTLGQVAIVPRGAFPQYLLSQSQMKVRIDPEKADSLYVYYYCSSEEAQEYLRNHTVQTGVPHINLDTLRKMPIPLPPLSEQRHIAHILGTLDDTIELNRRMNATLEAMARALFRSWFVDFDPVRAKAEGREPAGMDAETAALFPGEFEESELGEIPKGWQVKRIDELAEINSLSLTSLYEIDPIDYIEISEVSKGEVYSIQRYPRGKEPSRARRRLRHGDTVLSTVRPDRESYFLAYEPEPTLIASTGFAVITPTTAPWTFVYIALTRPAIFDYLGQVADGGAYPAIRADVIAGIETVWPTNPALVQKYHRLCKGWLAMAEKNKQQSRILTALRDILLPELLSGRVQINDICGSVADGS